MLDFCKKIWNKICCCCFHGINDDDNYNTFYSETRENGNNTNNNVSVTDDKFYRTPTSFDRSYTLSNEQDFTYNEIYR
jgi:hypothetical protein